MSGHLFGNAPIVAPRSNVQIPPPIGLHIETPIDRINIESIAAAPVLVGADGCPLIVACGGVWRRSIVGWQFETGTQAVPVAVPSTLAALEARDAEWRAQVAA